VSGAASNVGRKGGQKKNSIPLRVERVHYILAISLPKLFEPENIWHQMLPKFWQYIRLFDSEPKVLCGIEVPDMEHEYS